MPSHRTLSHVGLASGGASAFGEEREGYFPALPDETTFSYVTRAQNLNSRSRRSEVIRDLFGSSLIAVTRPFHTGFGAFSLHLYGEKKIDVVANHSLIALFQTFTPPNSYDNAVERAMFGDAKLHFTLLLGRKESYFKSAPALCTACVRQDLKQFYFAYYRRQHQVLASEYCAQHEEKLITSCVKCGSCLSFETLPTLNCPICGSRYDSGEADVKEIHRTNRIKLGKTINSILMGEIPRRPQVKRLKVIRARSEEIVSSRYPGLGNNLSRYIRDLYGDDFLRRLNLFPAAKPTFGWPSHFLSGATMFENPIANALLISVLWESANNFVEEL